MKKSGKKKSKKGKRSVRRGLQEAADAPVPLEGSWEDKTDYGGFPEMDLKKNLGCG